MAAKLKTEELWDACQALAALVHETDAQFRDAILDILATRCHVDVSSARAMSQDELAALPGHTLLGFGVDSELDIWLWAVPDATITPAQRERLDFARGCDVSPDGSAPPDNYAAGLPLLAALDYYGDQEGFEDEWRDLVESFGDDLPPWEELAATFGEWKGVPFIGQTSGGLRRPDVLDLRFTATAVLQSAG